MTSWIGLSPIKSKFITTQGTWHQHFSDWLDWSFMKYSITNSKCRLNSFSCKISLFSINSMKSSIVGSSSILLGVSWILSVISGSLHCFVSFSVTVLSATSTFFLFVTLLLWKFIKSSSFEATPLAEFGLLIGFSCVQAFWCFGSFSGKKVLQKYIIWFRVNTLIQPFAMLTWN